MPALCRFCVDTSVPARYRCDAGTLILSVNPVSDRCWSICMTSPGAGALNWFMDLQIDFDSVKILFDKYDFNTPGPCISICGRCNHASDHWLLVFVYLLCINEVSIFRMCERVCAWEPNHRSSDVNEGISVVSVLSMCNLCCISVLSTLVIICAVSCESTHARSRSRSSWILREFNIIDLFLGTVVDMYGGGQVVTFQYK